MFEAGADVEQARAQGAQEGLVARGGEEIDVVGLQVDGDVACGLCGVDEERDVVLARDGADFADRLDGAGDVAGVGDGDQFCIGADGAADFLGIDEACAIDGDAGLLEAAGVLESVQRAQD